MFSTRHVSRSVRFTQPNTDLEWIVVVTSPMVRSESDAAQPGDIIFVSLILVASVGVICCSTLLALWYSRRKERSVMYGDYKFTSAFIIGCILVNLSSFTLVGENTDGMCLTRLWATNLSFSLAIAPLFVKVYRVYMLVGSATRMRRKELNHKQATLCTLPIVAVEVTILLVFTLVDPPTAVEDIDLDATVAVHHIQCKQESNAFLYTETIYKAVIVLTGCALSYYSRNLDRRFGEAKQLLFGMYNIAFTGLCLLLLAAFVDASPTSIHMFQAVGSFWGTTLTCAVFVIPRLLPTEESDRKSSVHVSGISVSAVPSGPFPQSSILRSGSFPDEASQSERSDGGFCSREFVTRQERPFPFKKAALDTHEELPEESTVLGAMECTS